MEGSYRVTQVHRDRYQVKNGTEELYCVLTGSLRYREEYPVAGDFVEITVNPYGDSLIRSILPRRTAFFRPDWGGHADGFAKNLQIQPLVANIDYIFIITSLNHDFSLNRIARYASMATAGGAVPVAVLTKADQCPNAEEMEKKVSELSSQLRVAAVSAYTGFGLERLQEYFTPGTTIALLGSSGAGKSTLINTLAGREIMQTGGIREDDSKGRHTTTHREMIEINGVFFIDTPGLRELGMIGAEEGISGTFSDIADLISQCAFSDCTHGNEPGCMIRRALENGSLTSERWETYLRLERENRRNKITKNEMMMNIAMNRRKMKEQRKGR